MDYENNPEINIFRDYLRIPTVHPNIDYEPCLEFLKSLAKDLQLDCKVSRPGEPDKPFLIMKWPGSKPQANSILLHSHMDVVPVFEEYWTHPPFRADIDSTGRIYARGAQDMKCVGMQYLGAIRRLKAQGFVPTRTIFVSFGCEEELGGAKGMKVFVESSDFREMNIGFALDEGIAAPDDVFPVFYAERTVRRLYFIIKGSAGHGSLLLANTAGEKVNYILKKLTAFRDFQAQMLENNPELTTGDVTTVNLTQMKGGVQSNVIPASFTLGFDIRFALDQDMEQFDSQLREWCTEAGGEIEIDYETKHQFVQPTDISDSNPYWVAFRKSMEEMKLSFKTRVFPGGTDSRYLRAKNIPAIGFSPMNNTPVLLHDHDEFLDASVYLKGIDTYTTLISKISSLE